MERWRGRDRRRKADWGPPSPPSGVAVEDCRYHEERLTERSKRAAEGLKDAIPAKDAMPSPARFGGFVCCGWKLCSTNLESCKRSRPEGTGTCIGKFGGGTATATAGAAAAMSISIIVASVPLPRHPTRERRVALSWWGKIPQDNTYSCNIPHFTMRRTHAKKPHMSLPCLS